MSLDKLLLQLLEAQQRIAAALEALVENQGIVPEPSQDLPGDDDASVDDLDEEEFEELEEELEELEEELEEEELEDDLDELEEEEEELEEEEEELDEEPPAASKKKTKKKAAKKAPRAKKTTKKKSKIGKSHAKSSKYTADEVRGKLKDLQLATGSAAQAKSILKKNGASTFGQLKPARYDHVVTEVDKLLED
jgi:DNA repair exonuclease SbcCD ATPase subunit